MVTFIQNWLEFKLVRPFRGRIGDMYQILLKGLTLQPDKSPFKNLLHKNKYTRIFISALFIILKKMRNSIKAYAWATG